MTDNSKQIKTEETFTEQWLTSLLKKKKKEKNSKQQ